MRKKSEIENLLQTNGYIKRAAKKAEEKSRICERFVKDILDEIGDCLHDDAVFRKKMLTGVFLHPKMRRRIAFKFISAAVQ
ncbi:MAG: hypothetical protein ABIE75_02840 [Candidatus Omnitrophota bacterium]